MSSDIVTGLKEDNVLCTDDVLALALKACEKCLSGKKVEILEMISEMDDSKSITSAVEDISDALGCPRSTIWFNVRQLHELGLIKNGRGNPVRLTAAGRFVMENMRR